MYTVNSLNFAGTYFCGWGVKELLRGFIFADPGGFPILITWENAWNHYFAGINFCGLLKTAKSAKINPAHKLMNLQYVILIILGAYDIYPFNGWCVGPSSCQKLFLWWIQQ